MGSAQSTHQQLPESLMLPCCGSTPHMYMLLLAAGRPFDVMVTKPNVDCSIDAASQEMYITQVLQVCMASQYLT